MGVTFGMCPDTWGIWFAQDDSQPPWQRYLDEVAAAGYHYLELGPLGYLPSDSGRLAMELSSRGLKLLAGTLELSAIDDVDNTQAVREEASRVGALAAALGARFLVLVPRLYTDLRTGEIIGPRELDADGWADLVGAVQELGSFVKGEFGLTLTFHPTADSAVQFDKQASRFLEDTDPGSVSLCLDTGHFEYRGGDSVAFFREWHSRIPYIHLKDIDASVRDRVTRERLPFVRAVAERVFCEPGKGIVKFGALAAEIAAMKYEGWAGIETDMYPLKDLSEPLPIATRTREYLEALGWTAGPD